MWACWQEKQTLRSVSRKCHVSLATVSRYRGLDKWDRRLAKIQGKAIEKADSAVVKRRAKQLVAVAKAFKSYVQQLDGKTPCKCPNCKHEFNMRVPKLLAQFRDVDMLVRLQEFLAGEADSRPEQVLRFEMVYPEGYTGPPRPVESEVV